MLPQYNGQIQPVTRTIWYSGSDVLRTGYALCFDAAASPTANDPKQRLGIAAVKPAAGNLGLFAGVVAEGSDGKQGPCFVDVIVPRSGDVVSALTQENMTAGTTVLGPVAASYALASKANFSVVDAVAVAAETVDTTGAAAVKNVKLQ